MIYNMLWTAKHGKEPCNCSTKDKLYGNDYGLPWQGPSHSHLHLAQWWSLASTWPPELLWHVLSPSLVATAACHVNLQILLSHGHEHRTTLEWHMHPQDLLACASPPPLYTPPILLCNQISCMYETHSFTLLFNISIILHSGNNKVLTSSENHSNDQPHTYICPLELYTWPTSNFTYHHGYHQEESYAHKLQILQQVFQLEVKYIKGLIYLSLCRMHHVKHSDLKFCNPRTDQMQGLENKMGRGGGQGGGRSVFFLPPSYRLRNS